MSPREKRENNEIIIINGEVYVKEIFGREAMKTVNALNQAGKTINLMQTTLMRKNEGKRFYI